MRTTYPILGTLSLALGLIAFPAHALIGLNQCGPGTKPPTGMHCGHDELFLGYRNASGACVWVCCPPNSDGKTYNCSGEPTPSDKLDLGTIRPRQWSGVFTPLRALETPPTTTPPTTKGSATAK